MGIVGSRARLAVAAGAVLLVLGAGVAAGEEPPPAGVVDVRAHLQPLQDALADQVASPSDVGHEGALRTAWRDAFRRRIASMRRRVEDLGDKGDWVTDEPSQTVRGLDPGKWKAFVRTLATLHTELGTCAKSYRETKVDGAAARRRWLRRYPRPDPIGEVASAPALREVQRAILALVVQGLEVPYSLRQARDRLQRAVWAEEEIARAEKQREYDERRYAAFTAIQADVDATRGRLEEVAQALADGQASLRDLLATAQRVEEDRLREMVRARVQDEEQAAHAEELLTKMRDGRIQAFGFGDRRLSRYGATIEQKWMVPRAALLKLLEKTDAD